MQFVRIVTIVKWASFLISPMCVFLFNGPAFTWKAFSRSISRTYLQIFEYFPIPISISKIVTNNVYQAKIKRNKDHYLLVSVWYCILPGGSVWGDSVLLIATVTRFLLSVKPNLRNWLMALSNGKWPPLCSITWWPLTHWNNNSWHDKHHYAIS